MSWDTAWGAGLEPPPQGWYSLPTAPPACPLRTRQGATSGGKGPSLRGGMDGQVGLLTPSPGLGVGTITIE